MMFYLIAVLAYLYVGLVFALANQRILMDGGKPFSLLQVVFVTILWVFPASFFSLSKLFIFILS